MSPNNLTGARRGCRESEFHPLLSLRPPVKFELENFGCGSAAPGSQRPPVKCLGFWGLPGSNVQTTDILQKDAEGAEGKRRSFWCGVEPRGEMPRSARRRAFVDDLDARGMLL